MQKEIFKGKNIKIEVKVIKNLEKTLNHLCNSFFLDFDTLSFTEQDEKVKELKAENAYVYEVKLLERITEEGFIQELVCTDLHEDVEFEENVMSTERFGYIYSDEAFNVDDIDGDLEVVNQFMNKNYPIINIKILDRKEKEQTNLTIRKKNAMYNLINTLEAEDLFVLDEMFEKKLI